MNFILLINMMLLVAGGQRDFIDPVGFSTTKEQIQAVVEYSKQQQGQQKGQERGQEQQYISERDLPTSPMIAAICPHDDHIYAGPLYIPVMERVKAKHLILIGVFHKAKKFNVEDKLIFDDFESWKGPLGPLSVDASFRSAVMKELPEDAFVVSNEYHQEEHSLEAFTGFIQTYDPDATILPILVPYMNWERMDELASGLSQAIAKVMTSMNWKPGEDVQIIISNDSTHYGDQGWGGKNFAPFGADAPGLTKAKAQDIRIIKKYLLGSIGQERLRKLLYTLVDEKDVHEYKTTWCGRFAIPFGLDFTERLAKLLGQPVPRGWLMGYGTSVEMGELPVRELGLGVTAPANLHHWVAYSAIGFFKP